MKSLSLLFFTFILISCGTTLRERITEHAVTRISYWPSENLTLPLEKKVLPVPREILEFVSLDNEYKGYKQRPREVLLTKKQKLDIKNALKEIPEAVSRVVRDKLLAIYFVEDLGGSGFAEGVTDKDGKIVASFILFDIAVLNRKANSWASWKENTPFKSNSPYRVEAIIEEEANNNRKNAIQYIVLHELGHVASIGAKIHPCWKNWIAEGEKFEDFEFMNLSWREDKKEGLKSIHDSVFLERSEIQYYRAENKRFAADRMKSIYKKLEKTDFISLYAAINPFG